MTLVPSNQAPASSSALSRSGLRRVQAGWAERLALPPDALTSAGTHFFPREAAIAVVVLQLGQSCVVVAPPPVMRLLEGLGERALLDAQALTAKLGAFDAQPIGTATLSYRDRRPVEQPRIPITSVEPAMVDQLRARIHPDEWDESGLSAMPQLWAAVTPVGSIAAVAGYERWGANIAQMGVVADAAERRRGYAAAASAAAMTEALNAGLVLQWRSRVGNTASDRLAARLGYTPLGFQSALALG